MLSCFEPDIFRTKPDISTLKGTPPLLYTTPILISISSVPIKFQLLDRPHLLLWHKCHFAQHLFLSPLGRRHFYGHPQKGCQRMIHWCCIHIVLFVRNDWDKKGLTMFGMMKKCDGSLAQCHFFTFPARLWFVIQRAILSCAKSSRVQTDLTRHNSLGILLCLQAYQPFLGMVCVQNFNQRIWSTSLASQS